jgi:hypothetical protein
MATTTTTLNDLLSSITSAVAQTRRTADSESEKTRLLYQRVPALASLSVPRLRIPEITLEIPVVVGAPTSSPEAIRIVSQALVSALPEAAKAASDEMEEIEISGDFLSRLAAMMSAYAGSLTVLPEESEVIARVDDALVQLMRRPGFLALVKNVAENSHVGELGMALESMVRNHIEAYFMGKALTDAVIWLRKQIRSFLQGLAASNSSVMLVTGFDQHFEALFEDEVVARVLNDPEKPSEEGFPTSLRERAFAAPAPLGGDDKEPEILIGNGGLSDAIERTADEVVVDYIALNNFVIATRMAFSRTVAFDGMMATVNDPEIESARELRSRATSKVRELVRGALQSAKDVAITLLDPLASEPLPEHLLTRLKIVLAEEGSG